MAKLYDRSPVKPGQTPPKPGQEKDPQEILKLIETFLVTCRRPAILEYGEEPVPLKPGEYALEIRSGRLWLEACDESRCVSRRVIAMERVSGNLLDGYVQRFGGKDGKITFLDLDRPQTAHRSLLGSRQRFAEKFRRMLSRQFPGWQIPALSTGLDLQRSFSSSFPRARLSRGNQVIAAMACPSAEDEAAMLTFALLWHEHLRSQLCSGCRLSLSLFLPGAAGTLTAHRLRWLTGAAIPVSLFRFNEHGSAGEVDPSDLGNLETRVCSRFVPAQLSPDIGNLLQRLRTIDGIGCCPELGGSLSISCRGLEFARIEVGRILLGLEDKHEVSACHTEEVEHFAIRLSGLSELSGGRHSAPATFPERWFETAVRSNITAIHPQLLGDPVHSQVLSFAAQNRDLIDLLGVTCSGQLVVLELKASEDIHLPLQALDYWMRIRWHAERAELQHLFPGIPLGKRPPKLLLVAPGMAFHPACTSILRHFAPEIEVERVGVNTEWHKRFQIVLLLRGADLPVSHKDNPAAATV